MEFLSHPSLTDNQKKGIAMNLFCKRLLVTAFMMAVALPLLAHDVKSEDELIADMSSPKAKTVTSALQDMEKQYPTSVPGIAKAKSLLTDDRLAVREKAARVLGAIHADVSDADLDNIAKLLDGPGKDEIIEGLKALRGLKAQSTVPKIVPLLKSPEANVKRDACRTLAVLADKSVVPDIQPLLQDPDKAVVKDASDAIFTLNNK